MAQQSFTIPSDQNSGNAKLVEYHLYVSDTVVNYSGKKHHAIAINGMIPGPELTFTEGDTAQVYVHNLLRVNTSIHWHGVFLPNRFDGVPYLTQEPIHPNETFVYKFPVTQNGTYWYHSHAAFQEQSGMYGALIFKKRIPPPQISGPGETKKFRKGIDDLPSVPVVISDWTDINPKEVDRLLHHATDWFAIKKKATQSFSEAIASGNLKTKLMNEWKRMLAMDVSDVWYNRFLINGKNQNELAQFKAGDKVRLQIINGGASSYFWLTWGGGKITVVANDGNDIEPVEVDRLLIAVAETYDVIVTIPENRSYEFLATAEDRSSSASLWIGNGMKMPAPHLEKLKYFQGMKMMNSMMKMNGDLDMSSMGNIVMSNQSMDMNEVMYPEITGAEKAKESKTDHESHNMNSGNENMPSEIVTLNYAMLRSTDKTTLTEGSTRTLKFTLTGNMNRYVWTLDNKTLSESDKILIHKGENIRMIIFNNSMMRHPMHLHGHDFRVLNGQGEFAPLKNVLDIMPMEVDTIEFAPVESTGDWFFHCHLLYHMMSGMGRVFSYAPSVTDTLFANPKKAQRKFFSDDRHFHFMTKVGIETNGSDGEALFANKRWKLETMWHLGYHSYHGYESETMLGRYFGKMQWLYAYAGFDYHYKTEGDHAGMEKVPENIFGSEDKNMFGQVSNKNNRQAGVIGIAYTLPTLTVSDLRIDTDGKLRLQFSREDIPVTPRLRFNWMVNTDKEYMAGFRYIISRYLSVSTHYDSDMSIGIGFTFTY